MLKFQIFLAILKPVRVPSQPWKGKRDTPSANDELMYPFAERRSKASSSAVKGAGAAYQ